MPLGLKKNPKGAINVAFFKNLHFFIDLTAHYGGALE